MPLPSSLTKYPHGRIRATLQLPRANIWDGLHIDKDSNDRKWKWKSQTLVNREYLYNYCKNNKKAIEIPIEHIAVDEWDDYTVYSHNHMQLLAQIVGICTLKRDYVNIGYYAERYRTVA